MTWASDDAFRLKISNADGSRGLATGLAAAATNISASFGGVSGGMPLPVTSATVQSIEVTAPSSKLPIGFTQRYVAIATLSDDTTRDITLHATWSSSDATVASLSNATGAKGIVSRSSSVGSATITATYGGVSGSTTLTVTSATLQSVEVTPSQQTIPPGLTPQMMVTGIFSDGTAYDVGQHATWSSSNPALVSISNAMGTRGLARGVAPGTANVTATVDAISGSTPITVSAASLTAIEVNPSGVSLPAGFKQQYTATGFFSDGTNYDITTRATWTSTTPSVATLSNAAGTRGRATGIAPGMTQARASMDGTMGQTSVTISGASLASIDVFAESPELPLGYSQRYIAIANFSDGSAQEITNDPNLTWSTSDDARLKVSNADGSRGVATAISTGPVQVTAQYGAVGGMAPVTVTSATLVSIDLSPPNWTVAAGHTLPMKATGAFSDGSSLDVTTRAVWTSTTPSVATVSNAAGSHGLMTGVAPGMTQIGAQTDGVAGSTSLTVTP